MHVERRLLHKGRAQLLGDDALEKASDPIGAEGAQEKQHPDVVLCKSLSLFSWNARALGFGTRRPALPGVQVSGDVLGKAGEARKHLQSVDLLPCAVQPVWHTLRVGSVKRVGKGGEVIVVGALEPPSGDDQLVAREETAADELEDAERDAVAKGIASGGHDLVGRLLHFLSSFGVGGVKLFAGLRVTCCGLAWLGRGVDGVVEDLDEGRQTVDIVRVDAPQTVHQEEQSAAPARHEAILLRRDANGLLRFLVALCRDRDFVRHLLGVLKLLDQRDVLGDIALGLRQVPQDVVLEFLDANHVLVALANQVHRELAELRPFLLDGERQDLVLQPPLGDGEVHQRGLRLHLRRVYRVAKLGVQVQAEVRVELHVLVAQLDVGAAAAPGHRPGDEWRENRVQRLAQVLDDYAGTVLQRKLERRQQRRRAQTKHLELPLFAAF
eukprot:scaffold1741_cov262-Pinguiococcus_pyrenoidosus.AAC.5